MADYSLYYWNVPFRGQFIRAILAHAGKSFDEADSGTIGALMEKEPDEQPVPFMGPPVLIDNQSGFALSQMPAIALYLGLRLGLVPDDPAALAMTAKIVNDANDVIDEMTLDGGREMWTPESWEDFQPRLRRWMKMFEATAARNGMEAQSGFLLGTPEPGIADIVTATLWITISDRFPPIARLLSGEAPRVAGLSSRLYALPGLRALKAETDRKYGSSWCGGQIGKSLEAVAGR